MTNGTYPQNPAEWQSAIQDGIGVDKIQGREAFQAGKFPYEELAPWIRKAYSAGYSPSFVPALLRNMKGLAAWVYGDGDEPCWPGSDHDDKARNLS